MGKELGIAALLFSIVPYLFPHQSSLPLCRILQRSITFPKANMYLFYKAKVPIVQM